MKKWKLLFMAAACILVGCQGKEAAVETEKVIEKPEVHIESEKSGEQSEIEIEDNRNSEAETPEISESETSESVAENEMTENEQEMQTASQLHIALTRNYESEWSDEYRKQILTAQSDNIRVLNDGYDGLNDSLEKFNEESFHELLGMYEENLEWAKEMAAEGNPGEWFLHRDMDVVRADENILSFWNTQTDYLGGAHGGYYASGVNFDSKTGEILELQDVVTDYEKLYDMFLTELTEKYGEETFFPEWRECLDEMFLSETEDEVYALEWTMDQNGIQIWLNPYVISPWAAGVLKVEISFEEYEDLILSKYVCDVNDAVTGLLPGERYAIGDDLVSFSYTVDENTFQNQFQIMKENGDICTTLNKELYGLFSKAYVVEKEDGKPYLYVELKRENDYCLLEVFDMGDNFCHVGTCEAAFYDNPMTNTENFALYSRVYVLGTYMAYKEYRVGEDGMPVTEDEVFNVVNWEDDTWSALKTTRELTASIQGVKEVLPAGTGMRMKRTDGETFAEMELSDGRICDISLERDKERYGFLIDGVNEFECFEMLPYAG